ncbi:hypothetical protein A2U01_0059614, partial [Trifolium medium]|nr:hypothetical protein [Trifolium medium]
RSDAQVSYESEEGFQRRFNVPDSTAGV